ncbi:MAG: hypothetical protein ABI560_16510, partial [Myxococcales bacterium]
LLQFHIPPAWADIARPSLRRRRHGSVTDRGAGQKALMVYKIHIRMPLLVPSSVHLLAPVGVALKG